MIMDLFRRENTTKITSLSKDGDGSSKEMALMTSTKLRQLLQRRKEALNRLKHISAMKNYTDSEYNFLILHVKTLINLSPFIV